MTAWRSGSLKRPQAVISAEVRPQPMQIPMLPSTMQTCTQGVEMEAMRMKIEGLRRGRKAGIFGGRRSRGGEQPHFCDERRVRLAAMVYA